MIGDGDVWPEEDQYMAILETGREYVHSGCAAKVNRNVTV